MVHRMEAACRAFREAEVRHDAACAANGGDDWDPGDTRSEAWADVVHEATEVVEYEDSLEGYDDTHSYVRNAATCVGGEGE